VEKVIESQVMRPEEIIISFLKINSNLKNRGSVVLLIFALLPVGEGYGEKVFTFSYKSLQIVEIVVLWISYYSK